MTYLEATDYLFNALPVFQSQGPGAYKPGLQTVTKLSEAFGSPHQQLRTIHVGGTNGKGSTAHTIAAVLQSAGMRVGLFTSPHLVDFRERIRINGQMIPEEDVVSFVERFLADQALTALQPSFFELTTVMAFEYFARQQVDVAVIEVGLGGRLDSTNIIRPDLCVITNISLDHTALLGHTEAEIAAEKAGIIKPQTPVVISETTPETLPVFQSRAAAVNAPLILAPNILHSSIAKNDELPEQSVATASRRGAVGDAITTNVSVSCSASAKAVTRRGAAGNTIHHPRYGEITLQLTGVCQQLNARGILAAIEQLERQGYPITPEAVRQGFGHVCQLTGLMGRWMQVADHPRTICDTGHNIGGWQLLVQQLKSIACSNDTNPSGTEETAQRPTLHMALGFVNDKDISKILKLIAEIPAKIYWTQPSVPRARPAADLAAQFAELTQQNDGQLPSENALHTTVATASRRGAANAHVKGRTATAPGIYHTVAEAYAAAKAAAAETDTIFVGGSTFVVADLLTTL